MLRNFTVRRVLTRELEPQNGRLGTPGSLYCVWQLSRPACIFVCYESDTMSGGTGEGHDTIRIAGVSVADIWTWHLRNKKQKCQPLLVPPFRRGIHNRWPHSKVTLEPLCNVIVVFNNKLQHPKPSYYWQMYLLKHRSSQICIIDVRSGEWH